MTRAGRDAVGPVLHAGASADAVVAAIRAMNADVETEHRGAYVRVLVPSRCRVTREEVERVMGAPFRLPGDLERVMSSFRGRMSVTEDEVSWEMPEALEALRERGGAR